MLYLSSVKLGCKTARVSNGFRAAALVDDGGEADNDRCLNSGSSEEVGTSEVRDIMCHLKEPLGTGSPGVDNALRNPFSGEVGNFLHQMIILKQNWTCPLTLKTSYNFCKMLRKLIIS